MIDSAKNLMSKIQGKTVVLPMRASAEGLSIIRHFEGFAKLRKDGKYSSYLCSAGVWTIGIGSTLGIIETTVWTKAQCEARFVNDVRNAENALNAMLKTQLKQGQFDALVSMIFNFGGPRISKSTLVALVNAGNTELAASEFARWNKETKKINGKNVLVENQGLTRRRLAEMNCYLGIPQLLA